MLHSTGRQLEYVQSKNANCVQSILLNAIIYLYIPTNSRGTFE